jgi:hypothetical protein
MKVSDGEWEGCWRGTMEGLKWEYLMAGVGGWSGRIGRNGEDVDGLVFGG